MRTYLQKLAGTLDSRLSARATLILLLLIGGLFYYPVISADVTYHDDTSRDVSTTGFHNFQIHGRFIAEWITQAMSGFNSPIIDYGQLGQILGVIAIVGASWFLLRRRLDFSYRSILLVLPLILNPFMLQNISYQYDALGMLLGYALAILAFAIFAKTKASFAVVTLLLYVSLGLYQAMPTIFLALSLVWLVLEIARHPGKLKAHILTVVTAGASYVVAIIAHVLTTRYIIVATSGHHSRNTDLSLSSITDNLKRLAEVLLAYFQGGAFGVVIIALFLISLLALGVVIYQHRLKTGHVAIILAALLALPFTLLGPLIISEGVVIEPRVLPAIAIIGLAPAAALVALKSKRFASLQLALVGILTIFSAQNIILSYTYGSFMRNQDNYRQVQVASIYNAIQYHELHDATFYTEGVGGGSINPTISRKALEQYPILARYWGSTAIHNTWTTRLLANLTNSVVVDWNPTYPEKQAAICGEENIKPIVNADNYAIFYIPNQDEKEYMIFLRSSHKIDYCKDWVLRD